MRWECLLVVILVLAGFLSCREAGSKNGTGVEIEENANKLKEAVMDDQRPAELSPETLDTLTRALHPTIGVVRCERVEVIFAGTQSESRIVHATVVKAGLGLEKGPCSFRFFASEALRMEKGRLYLVAAYGLPGREELPLFEKVEVSSENDAHALESALREFERIKSRD